MPTTSPDLLPYPGLGDAPNGPSAVQSLAVRLQTVVTGLKTRLTTLEAVPHTTTLHLGSSLTQPPESSSRDADGVLATLVMASAGYRRLVRVEGWVGMNSTDERVFELETGATSPTKTVTYQVPQSSGRWSHFVSRSYLVAAGQGFYVQMAARRTSGTGSYNSGLGSGAFNDTRMYLQAVATPAPV